MANAGDMVIGDDGWLEIVGEQTRGGGGPSTNTLLPAIGAEGAFELLGEMMEKSPAFRSYAEKRAAASRPIVRRTKLQQAQDWQIDFGPVSGLAGTTTTLTVSPQCHFRGEKVMATDSGGNAAGFNTSIGTILIGQRLQRPASTNTLTAFFAQTALGNGVKWHTCEKALSIAVTVSFITPATFFMTVFGKAVL